MKKYIVFCADTKEYGEYAWVNIFNTYKEAETAAKRKAVISRQDVYVASTIKKALMPMPDVEMVAADVEDTKGKAA